MVMLTGEPLFNVIVNQMIGLFHNVAWCGSCFSTPVLHPLARLVVAEMLQLDQLQLVLLGGDTGPEGISPALRFSHHHLGLAHPSEKYHGTSFFGQQSIRTRQILLGFYLFVQGTSKFMFAWKGNGDQNISLKFIANFARTMWL
jgi:hypothetical protein